MVDPIRQTRGFFQWRDGGLQPVGGFYLSAQRGDRVGLARLVDDLENIPSADGGGGGLSPRLEAELIAMLTRPAQVQSSPLERAQAAALFGLLGVVLGVLGLLAAAWLITLNRSVQDQSAELREIKAVQHLALDTLLSDAGRGDLPDRFTEQYERRARELAEARRSSSPR